MTTRWIVSVALVCSMATAMTGCKSWFSKKPNPPPTGTGSEVLPPIITEPPISGGSDKRGTEFDGTNVVAVGQFEAVLFAFDGATVEDAERAKVEKVADFLKANVANVVVCEGNCDERGSTEYNMSLGERRALSVRAYLMSLGIDANRIQTKSYGKERPKDPGHAETAWRVNRRVEFVVLKN